jgi:NADH-quinone oxidoreductase subunit C
MTPQELISQLQARFAAAISDATEFRGQCGVTVTRGQIVPVCQFLKTDRGFDMLTDLAGVDNYGTDPRFEVDYTLYSFTHRFWFRLKTKVSEDDMTLDSVTGVWATANWHEREAFDMFGLRFRGHPNLKRILMWDGYPYFPLRKDFPLAGMDANLPETAVGAGKVEPAPMLGGPFVAGGGQRTAVRREPRQYDTIAEQQDQLPK